MEHPDACLCHDTGAVRCPPPQGLGRAAARGWPLAVLWAAAAACAAAQETVPAKHAGIYELSLERLADLVVTDTKIAQPHRTVTQKLESIGVEDMERTAAVFDLLLGDNLQGRKDHIAEDGYKYLELADIS